MGSGEGAFAGRSIELLAGLTHAVDAGLPAGEGIGVVELDLGLTGRDAGFEDGQLCPLAFGRGFDVGRASQGAAEDDDQPDDHEQAEDDGCRSSAGECSTLLRCHRG